MLKEKETLIDLIDFFDFKNKGLVIFDDENNLIKVNERFYKIFKFKADEKNEAGIKKFFETYQIDETTKYFYNQNKNQINVYYKRMEGDFNITLWKFEEVSDKRLRMNLLENIVEFCRDGIHAVDLDGNIIVYNEAQGKIDHYRPEEVMGRHVQDIYALDYDSSLLLTVLRTKKPITNIRQGYYTTEGTFVDCVTSVIPLFYHDMLIGSAAIVRDYNGVLQILDEEQKQVDQSKIQTMTAKPNYKSKDTRYSFDNIITVNPDLLKCIQIAKQTAQTDSNILIIGETGTGKEMFAQSIHAYSARRKKPFLAINCAAIPESLLEGLLFGTTKGAFTGAMDKAGLFEEADGGTIFLDEINSMSLFLQSKLLRVLEERTITRLGSNKLIHVSARIISSCNENPIQAIQENNFRSDLFYRLAVVYIVIPSLRVRRDDLEVLTKHFIQYYNQKLEKHVVDVDERVKKLFQEYPWPGNVRQLRHLLESAMTVVRNNEAYIGIEHLPKYILGENIIGDYEKNITENATEEKKQEDETVRHDNIFDELKEKEREYIINGLRKNNGNIAKTAKQMGMSRQKLYYKLKKYHLK